MKKARLSVLWHLTQRTSYLKESSFPLFNFSRTEKHSVGDLVQARPDGVFCQTDLDMSVFREGDVGTVTELIHITETVHSTYRLHVMWEHNGERSVLRPESWHLFPTVRRGAETG